MVILVAYTLSLTSRLTSDEKKVPHVVSGFHNVAATVRGSSGTSKIRTLCNVASSSFSFSFPSFLFRFTRRSYNRIAVTL